MQNSEEHRTGKNNFYDSFIFNTLFFLSYIEHPNSLCTAQTTSDNLDEKGPSSVIVESQEVPNPGSKVAFIY